MNAIKFLRKKYRFSQKELADQLNVDQTLVSKWELGKSYPNRETEVMLAEIFNVTVNQLSGKEKIVLDIKGDIIRPNNIFNFPNIHPIEVIKMPMLGPIAAGEAIEMFEERDIYVLAGSKIKADFCLTVQGDSMIGARIFDGDIVFVRKQPDVLNGQIAAVRIDNEATLKRVYKHNGSLSLIAENPAYPPIIINGNDGKDVSILGLAVAFQSVVR